MISKNLTDNERVGAYIRLSKEDFNFETKEWSWGHYFNDKKTALKYFTENYIMPYLEKEEIEDSIPEEKPDGIVLLPEELGNMDKAFECEKLEKEMKDLELEFKKLTINDSNLVEQFKEEYPSGEPKIRFSSIRVAGSILAGISIRNIQRQVSNLDGEIEKSPYTHEQEQMIDKYNEKERKLERISDELEMYNYEDDMEF